MSKTPTPILAAKPTPIAVAARAFRMTAEIDAQLQALLLVNRQLVEALQRFDVNRLTPDNEAPANPPAANQSEKSAPQHPEAGASASPRSRTAA